MSKRGSVEERVSAAVGNVTQVTPEQRRSRPQGNSRQGPPPEPKPRMSDDEVQANMTLRCPSCGHTGELVESRLNGYAATCRIHGRFTKWQTGNVDVLTAEVISRERLKVLEKRGK